MSSLHQGEEWVKPVTPLPMNTSALVRVRNSRRQARDHRMAAHRKQSKPESRRWLWGLRPTCAFIHGRSAGMVVWMADGHIGERSLGCWKPGRPPDRRRVTAKVDGRRAPVWRGMEGMPPKKSM